MKSSKRQRLIPTLDKEFKGNIWNFIGKADAICFTINLHMYNEKNIMGAGIAKEVKERYPGIDHNIYWVYDNFGFNTHIMKTEFNGIHDTKLIAFPTKPEWIRVNKDRSNLLPKYKSKFRIGDDAPGWMGYSDLKLIKKSAISLMGMIKAMGLNMVICPKPGCFNGGLDWKEVRGVLKEVGLYYMDSIYFIEKG